MAKASRAELDPGIIDSLQLAHDEVSRGVDPNVLADLGGYSELATTERMTYPTARNKGSEFICGCTVDVEAVPPVEVSRADARAKLPASEPTIEDRFIDHQRARYAQPPEQWADL